MRIWSHRIITIDRDKVINKVPDEDEQDAGQTSLVAEEMKTLVKVSRYKEVCSENEKTSERAVSEEN